MNIIINIFFFIKKSVYLTHIEVCNYMNKKIPQSIKKHLKDKGWILSYENNDILNILKKHYYLNLSITDLLMKKTILIPINSTGFPYVYVLMKNNYPIYVGMTKNLITRIAYHEKDLKKQSIQFFMKNFLIH